MTSISKMLRIIADNPISRPCDSFTIKAYIEYVAEREGLTLTYSKALAELNTAVEVGAYEKGWFKYRGKRNMYYWRKRK